MKDGGSGRDKQVLVKELHGYLFLEESGWEFEGVYGDG